MEITPELVELLATTRYANVQGTDGIPWAKASSAMRHVFTEFAQAFLEAADDAGVLFTVYAYRAEYQSLSLGLYATLAAAQACCEHDLRKNVDLEDYTLAWVPESASDAAITDLHLRRPDDDPATTYVTFDETTGYCIEPIELPFAFDPTAEG